MKKLIPIIILLVISIIVLSIFWRRMVPQQEGLIIQSANEQKVISWQELGKLNWQKLETKNGKITSTISVEALLQQNSVISKDSKIRFIAKDGGNIVFDKIEDCYLAKIKTDTGFYLRIVVPEDEFKQRWLKYIQKIEIFHD